MRSLVVATCLVLALAACGDESQPAESPTAGEAPVEMTLQEVAAALDCRGRPQGEAGYVGIRCEGSTLIVAEWADEEREDIENINGSMVGDPDLWFMATDSITVSGEDAADVKAARAALASDS